MVQMIHLEGVSVKEVVPMVKVDEVGGEEATVVHHRMELLDYIHSLQKDLQR